MGGGSLLENGELAMKEVIKSPTSPTADGRIISRENRFVRDVRRRRAGKVEGNNNRACTHKYSIPAYQAQPQQFRCLLGVVGLTTANARFRTPMLRYSSWYTCSPLCANATDPGACIDSGSYHAGVFLGSLCPGSGLLIDQQSTTKKDCTLPHPPLWGC